MIKNFIRQAPHKIPWLILPAGKLPQETYETYESLKELPNFRGIMAGTDAKIHESIPAHVYPLGTMPSHEHEYPLFTKGDVRRTLRQVMFDIAYADVVVQPGSNRTYRVNTPTIRKPQTRRR